MSIISLTEALAFLDLGTGYFEITAENDLLVMSYDGGSDTDVELTDGTYEGDDLATELQTRIDAAFTISSTVAYSSTTYKFTITVASGHTIGLDVSASDAALTFGFTEDPTAAVSIVSDQAATEDPTDIVDTINDAVDKWVKEDCQKEFESTAYTNKRYDGNGSTELFLEQYPIISVERLAIGTIDGIKVHNSSSDATRAVVTVNTTGLVLVITGGANAGSDTLLFADYATLTLLAAAVTALGKGWTGTVVNSSYDSHTSGELLPRYGAYCGITGGTTWAYLVIPDEPLTEFESYPNRGIIYYSGGFPEGHNNVIVNYTAGYSSDDMPEDLKLAVKILVKFIYQKRGDETFGVSQYSLMSVRSVFEKEMPGEARTILDRYRKMDV